MDGRPLARNRHKSSSRKNAKQTSDAAKPVAERAPASAKPAAGISSKRGVWIAAGVAAAIVLGAGLLYALYGSPGEPPQSASHSTEALSFVGSDTCASCHGGEAKLWHGSQHAHAMAHATKDTVLGDFNDASFDYFGVHSRFFRDELLCQLRAKGLPSTRAKGAASSHATAHRRQ